MLPLAAYSQQPNLQQPLSPPSPPPCGAQGLSPQPRVLLGHKPCHAPPHRIPRSQRVLGKGVAGGGRAGRKRSPGWENLRGPVGVRGPRAQQPQNTPGETSGGGYTTAPVKSSSAKGWGQAGKEGGRSQAEEEDSQGRTTGNEEGRNTCEQHGGSLLLWEARRDSALEGVQGIQKGVTRKSLQGDRGAGSTGRSNSIQREETRHKAPSRGYVHSPPCKEGSSTRHSLQPGQGQAAAGEAPAGDPACLQGWQGERGRHSQSMPAHGPPTVPADMAGSCPSSWDPIKGAPLQATISKSGSLQRWDATSHPLT